jgi:hypothetical protein
MSGEVVEFALHRIASPDERHRLRRFAFQRGINFEAQRLLARMLEQLTAQVDGVITCRIAYDRAAAEWVEHCVWQPSRAPAGDDVSAERAVALMRGLGRAD